jgi:hypothetical protein
MQTLSSVFGLLFGLLLMLPAAGIVWLTLRGNTIGMDPMFEAVIACMALAGVSTICWMTLKLMGKLR